MVAISYLPYVIGRQKGTSVMFFSQRFFWSTKKVLVCERFSMVFMVGMVVKDCYCKGKCLRHYNSLKFSFSLAVISWICIARYLCGSYVAGSPVVFRKIYLLEREWNLVFLWLLIEFHWICSSRSEDMKKLFVNIS